jgi:hypothetical protein
MSQFKREVKTKTHHSLKVAEVMPLPDGTAILSVIERDKKIGGQRAHGKQFVFHLTADERRELVSELKRK